MRPLLRSEELTSAEEALVAFPHLYLEADCLVGARRRCVVVDDVNLRDDGDQAGRRVRYNTRNHELRF